MKKRLLFLHIFFTITTFVNLLANDANYGLFIKAHPYGNNEKTSFILEDGKPLKLAKNSTLQFDLQVRPDMVFGIVCRIITDQNDNIDFTFTVGENDRRYPMLVVNESVYILPKEIEIDKWNPVSINLSSENNSITITYNGDTISAPSREISKSNSVKIYFGICTQDGYKQSDIASVNIRDIKINNNDQLIRHWKLDKHRDSKSVDLVAGIPAVAINEKWLSDIYASWRKTYSNIVSHNSHVAYNEQENLFYIADLAAKTITTFNPESSKEHTINIKSEYIGSNAPNQLYYDPNNNKLLLYNIDETKFSWFNFQTNHWNNKEKSSVEHGYWNNSTSYYPTDSALISFGGYGFYKYNNELLRINPYTSSIKKTVLPEIVPRYNSATTIVNNTLYIFGGRGNKSGRQELSPRNYYDFYSVNLKTEQTNLLWSIKPNEIASEFLPGHNMIYDKELDCFYMLANIGGGTLLRLDDKEKGFDLVAFPIDEDLTADYLYINLYYNANLKAFYGLIYKENSGNTTDVKIYSLKYPLTALAENYNIVGSKADNSTTSINPIMINIGLALLILAIVGAGTYYFYKLQSKRKKEKVYGSKENMLEKRESNNIGNLEIPSKVPEQNIKKGNYYDFSKLSINFLGSFSVKDKDGNNITTQFTPMLKHLLILLILSTAKDGKGIASRKLIQTFWFDKDEWAAKNNRNVYLSKLRSILDNLGNIDISNINKFWSIQFPKEVTCDYLEIIRLTSLTDETYSSMATEEKTERLLELLLRGGFLPNTEEDWLDAYKSDFSNLTIDSLTKLLQDQKLNFADSTKMKIADTIFLHDSLNEVALQIKCSILFNNDKKGLAKATYDSFQKEHSTLLGTEYKKTLNEIAN